MTPAIIDERDTWFGIEAPEITVLPAVEPNYLVEEPEEQSERLTALISKVTGGQVTASWRFVGMISDVPVYRLYLNSRPSSVKTRIGKEDFYKEVLDLVAELNGWDRNRMTWYAMGHAYQLRLGLTNVTSCYDNLGFEEAVAAAVKFARTKWVGLC